MQIGEEIDFLFDSLFVDDEENVAIAFCRLPSRRHSERRQRHEFLRNGDRHIGSFSGLAVARLQNRVDQTPIPVEVMLASVVFL